LKKKIIVLALNILIPIILAFIINTLLPDYKDFYASLNKIEIPMWVYPIVWTLIYIMIGFSNFLVYDKTSKFAEQIYLVQLFFNLMWTPIFFGLRNLTLSLVWGIVLFILVFINGIKYYKIKKEAGYLFIPYFLWTGFAIFLTSYILWLN